MKTTLQHYMNLFNTNNMTLVKYQLIKFKKRGVLFFKEDISLMQLDDEFHVYYYLLSHSSSKRDAFPIPKHRFILSHQYIHSFDMMKEHFETYYMNDVLDKEGFNEFDLKNPYIGEDYVWFCKRTS